MLVDFLRPEAGKNTGTQDVDPSHRTNAVTPSSPQDSFPGVSRLSDRLLVTGHLSSVTSGYYGICDATAKGV